VGDPAGTLGGEHCSPSFTSLSPPPIDDVNVLWPTDTPFPPPLCSASHANMPSHFKSPIQPSHHNHPAYQNPTANDTSPRTNSLLATNSQHRRLCYDEQPRHSRLYNLFPRLGHANLSPRRHCALQPIFPITCAPARTLAAVGVCLACHCDVAKGHRACKWTSTVRLLVRTPLGHTNGPQGFVCVYERAWDSDEEPAEGVWLGGHPNTDAGCMDVSANGLQGI
jgi:hypothetical protein